MRLTRFDDPDALFADASDRFVQIGAEAIRTRGRFLVALSGGETPRRLYDRLAASSELDWAAVDVFWADERSVPAGDPASNYGSAHRALLAKISIPAENVHRIQGELSPLAAADACEVELRRVGADGRLDLILLGMGADGHTASLFPRHQALTEAGRWIVPVHAPADPAWRVTMTLPLINAARHVLFLVTGKEKAVAVRDLQEGEPVPASMVRPANGTLTLLVDAEAASLTAK